MQFFHITDVLRAIDCLRGRSGRRDPLEVSHQITDELLLNDVWELDSAESGSLPHIEFRDGCFSEKPDHVDNLSFAVCATEELLTGVKTIY